MTLFKYGPGKWHSKLYYFEREIIAKWWNFVLGRNYTFRADNYRAPETIKFRPYAQTINAYELEGLTASDQVGVLAMRFNELVNEYNRMVDLSGIEG